MYQMLLTLTILKVIISYNKIFNILYKEGDFLKVKKIKKDIVNWLKRISYNSDDSVNKKTGPHCPNFATRCCITCNSCWKKLK